MNGTVNFDGKTDIVNSKEVKDNSVIRNETRDIEEDMLNTDAEKEDKDNSIVDDEDKNLNEITVDENVDRKTKNSNGHEETAINEGSSSKKKEDMECELEQNKSSKSFAVGFARALVEVSANKPLPYEIEVVYKNVDKEEICRKTIKVVYDWKPPCYSRCCGAKFAFQPKKKINYNSVSKESKNMPEDMNSQGNQ
nr:hypothetical protein [Tanacetum cinerariifolium]